MRIYFGSQTGTAGGFAHELSNEAEGRGMQLPVIDLEDFKALEFVTHSLVILIVATYGEGDPTENAMAFVDWLEKEAAADSLRGIRFAVMGCGDSGYTNFNAMGKRVDAAMERLGALRVHQRGIGDDSGDIEEDFARWRVGLWEALSQQGLLQPQPPKRRRLRGKSSNGITGGAAGGDGGAAPPSANSTGAGCASSRRTFEGAVALNADMLQRWQQTACTAVVRQCRVLVNEIPTSVQPRRLLTKHIELDISALDEEWRAGDTIEVLPCSDPQDIEWFLERLHFAEGVTAKEELRAKLAHCDLVELPPSSVLHVLAQCVQAGPEREALREFLSDQTLMRSLRRSPIRLSFKDFWKLFFTSVQITAEEFLQICPRMLPRPYTIASSPLEHSRTVAVTCSLVHEELAPLESTTAFALIEKRGYCSPETLSVLGRNQRVFTGICSSMLCMHCGQGHQIAVRLRPSVFRMPSLAKLSQSTAPIVMVAAGTGIAPFRGFVRERLHTAVSQRGQAVLFFGCRRRDLDFLYSEELEAAVSGPGSPPPLSQLICAFSQEQEDKVYVQHRILEHRVMLRDLYNSGACFYICGAPRMGSAAADAIHQALEPVGVSLTALRDERRLIEELWG